MHHPNKKSKFYYKNECLVFEKTGNRVFFQIKLYGTLKCITRVYFGDDKALIQGKAWAPQMLIGYVAQLFHNDEKMEPDR